LAWQPKLVYLVSHTHWDREWYLPFQAFRVKLARVVTRVLDTLENDPAFTHFVLDGQAILLEDHLAVRPEDGPRLRGLAQAGKLSVGPWYILPDLFLVSGEATVRNLLLGHRTTADFGPVQKVGYLPDSFGHFAQLPQILRQAGIDSFIYTRGNGDEIDRLGWTFNWQAPDGSEVLAVNLCGGYCNAGALGLAELWHAHTRREIEPARAVEQVRALFEKLAERNSGDVVLLGNGCDHFPPQRDLAAILAVLREAFPGTEFRHGSFADYLAALRADLHLAQRGARNAEDDTTPTSADSAPPTWQGELRHGKLHPILSGVWSARMPLKQQNDACQTLLADIWEPVAAACHFLHGQEYGAGVLGEAWHRLLQNHPHDSICGCSTDEVHREMETRFASVQQSADQSLRQHLETLAPTFARQAAADRDTVICVMNPLPERRTEVITRLVALQPMNYDLKALRLLDAEGQLVPLKILATRWLERFWGVDYRTELHFADQQEQLQKYLDSFGMRIVRNAPDCSGESVTSRSVAEAARPSITDCLLTIQFIAEDLPSVGHAIYHLTDRPTSRDLVSTATRPPTPLQPPVPPQTGRPAGPPLAKSVHSQGQILENAYFQVRLHPDGRVDITDKKTGMSHTGLNSFEDCADAGDEYDFCPCPDDDPVQTVGLAGKVSIIADTGWSACLEAAFSWPLPARLENDRQRRSQERVDCPVQTRVCLTQDSRIVEITTIFTNRVQDHRLRAIFPTGLKSDTLVSDGHFYLNRRGHNRPDGKEWVQPPVATDPQQEYSLVQDGQRGLALLNRGLPEIELARDAAGAAVMNLTLLRAVGWLSRDDLATRNFNNAGPTLATPAAQCPGQHTFHYALVPFAGDDSQAGIKALSRRYRIPPLVIQGVADLHVAGGQGLVEKHSLLTAISTIKRHEQRDTLVVRVYNLTGQVVDERLTFGRPVQAAWRCDLLEERGPVLDLAGQNELKFSLAPHQIVTVEVDFHRDYPN